MGIERKTWSRLETGTRRPLRRWGSLEPVLLDALLQEFNRRAKRRR
jgi:hypothetical protein